MFKRLLVLTVFLLSSLWPMDLPPEPGDPYLIVNKATNELGWINDGEILATYDVATGKTKTLTPEGTFTIVVKAENPYYRSQDIVGGSKENPLGSRWIGFDAEETDGRIYGLHGTNQPETIKQYVSNGCIRLYNHDVEELYQQVPVGTKVWIGTRAEQSITALAKELKLLY